MALSNTTQWYRRFAGRPKLSVVAGRKPKIRHPICALFREYKYFHLTDVQSSTNEGDTHFGPIQPYSAATVDHSFISFNRWQISSRAGSRFIEHSGKQISTRTSCSLTPPTLLEYLHVSNQMLSGHENLYKQNDECRLGKVSQISRNRLWLRCVDVPPSWSGTATECFGV